MPQLILPSVKFGNLTFVTKLFKKEKDQKVKQKLNAIRLLMLSKGRNEVAEAIGVTGTAIYIWQKQWDKNGYQGLLAKYKGSKSRVSDSVFADIEKIVEIKQMINGKSVTGYAIQGYLKKNTKSR